MGVVGLGRRFEVSGFWGLAMDLQGFVQVVSFLIIIRVVL